MSRRGDANLGLWSWRRHNGSWGGKAHRRSDKAKTVRNAWLVTKHWLPKSPEHVGIAEGGITLYWHRELICRAEKHLLHWFSFYISVWILIMMLVILTKRYLLLSTCCHIFPKTRLLLYLAFFSEKEICHYYFFNIPNSCSNYFKIILLHYILYGICASEICFQPWTLCQVKVPIYTWLCPSIFKLIKC